MRARETLGALVAAAVAGPGNVCLAGVAEFDVKQAWIDAVGPFFTVDFTGFPGGTFITDEYADLGVLFTDGVDVILCCDEGFPNDGAGLNGVG